MSIQEMEDLKQQYLDEMKRLINLEYRNEIKIAELKENFNSMSIEINKKEKLQQLEQVANLSTYPSKHFNSFCYNDDDDDEDYTITVTPTLSTEEPDNSLSMGNEHLNTILATKSDEFIKFSVENLVLILSESEGIPENMCDVPFHDNSLPLDVSNDQFKDLFDSNDEFSLTDDDSFSIDNVEYVEASPPDSELWQYTTHSDSSLYDSFIFDLSINPFPLADELIHIISPPEYDCFFFKIEPNSRKFTMDVVEDISPTREPRVHNALSTHPTLQLNLKFKLSSESIFAYVVWIFLPFLLYLVAPQYLLSLGSEDTIFDPGICNYHFLGRMYLIGVELYQDLKS
nr:hypothetical protein [Tanacetum cinerariifolium]